MPKSENSDWAEASSGVQLLQLCADAAAEKVSSRDTEGLIVALANAENALRLVRRRLRRAVKGESDG